MSARNWIVWSNEHRAFWRANRCGYTTLIEQAGRYTKDEAEGICRSASPRANSSIHEGEPPEICMPAPEALERRSDEEIVEQALYDTTDETATLKGRPAPAMTTMLYRVCDNDGERFEEATRLVRLFMLRVLAKAAAHE